MVVLGCHWAERSGHSGFEVQVECGLTRHGGRTIRLSGGGDCSIIKDNDETCLSNLLSAGRLRARVSDSNGVLSMPPVRKQNMHSLHSLHSCRGRWEGLEGNHYSNIAGGENRAHVPLSQPVVCRRNKPVPKAGAPRDASARSKGSSSVQSASIELHQG